MDIDWSLSIFLATLISWLFYVSQKFGMPNIEDKEEDNKDE